MADKRKPQCRIIIEEGRSRVAVELFSASQFPGGEGQDGRYRVRAGRRWLRPDTGRYLFWTKAEVLGWLFWMADGRPDLPPKPAASSPHPDLPKGSHMAIENGNVTQEGVRMRDRVFTLTEPFQGPDGQWRVFLVGRKEPVLVERLLP